MSVWVTIPSKRPQAEAQEFVDRWRSMGYLVAIHRDTGDDIVECDYLSYGDYHGYAKTVNALIKAVMAHDTDAQWFVTGGDDTDPDPNKRAEEIASECDSHFLSSFAYPPCEALRGHLARYCNTFGVMQPTGDRFAGGSIDRIAGSPWIGRAFAEYTYGGNGPYWPEYWHMFVDEEIMQVALKFGVFWQRRGLVHMHHHFMRESNDIASRAVHKPTPDFLRAANSREHWNKFKALYEQRKAASFPGHEVLAEVCA